MLASEAPPPGYPHLPTVPVEDCPIATSLRFLGRKWTLTILRDIAFFPRASFGLIRRRNPGLRPRVLSTRLRELGREELVRRVAPPEDARHPYYELTPKGREVWPILAALFQFGTRHHADRVFADRTPRSLSDLYPNDADLMLGPLATFAQRASPGAGTVPGVRRPGRTGPPASSARRA